MPSKGKLILYVWKLPYRVSPNFQYVMNQFTKDFAACNIVTGKSMTYISGWCN